MFNLFRNQPPTDLLTSALYDERTFYPKFLQDLRRCRNEVIIESPFITRKRLDILIPILKQLNKRNVSIVVNTRHPDEHEDEYMYYEAKQAMDILQNIGVSVLYTGGHHRKLAILDRKVLFEGSLNILSQNESCEIMRRIDSEELAQQMIAFTKLHKFIQ